MKISLETMKNSPQSVTSDGRSSNLTRLKSFMLHMFGLVVLILLINFIHTALFITNVTSYMPITFKKIDEISNSRQYMLNKLHRKEEFRRNSKIFYDYENIFQVSNVSCAKMFAGSRNEILRGRRISKMLNKTVPLLSDNFYIKETFDCDTLIKSRGYITSYLTEEERDFPIAFSMLVFKDIEMVERLLRAIYRPQHFYCIHVDAKSDNLFFEAAVGIATCFQNVFMPSRRVNVVWGKFTVLEPELLCLEEIWSRSRKWKYFINLTGQEFPLKTNAELVKILTAYDGANDVEGTMKRAFKRRWHDQVPPGGLRPIKGSVHICVNRKFVDYILHNKTAPRLLNWVKRTHIPDETFFTKLNHNPQLGIPGSYKGLPEHELNEVKPFLTRFKNWNTFPKYPCAWKRVRGICILTTGDLPLLRKRPEMFANKFYLQDDRVVIGCLEEKHFNNTRDEYMGLKSFSATFYKNLGFVKNKVPMWTPQDNW